MFSSTLFLHRLMRNSTRDLKLSNRLVHPPRAVGGGHATVGRERPSARQRHLVRRLARASPNAAGAPAGRRAEPVSPLQPGVHPLRGGRRHATARAESVDARGGHAHWPTICDCGTKGLVRGSKPGGRPPRSPAVAGGPIPKCAQAAPMTMPAWGRTANRCPAPLPLARCAVSGGPAKAGRERPSARRRRPRDAFGGLRGAGFSYRCPAPPAWPPGRTSLFVPARLRRPLRGGRRPCERGPRASIRTTAPVALVR